MNEYKDKLLEENEKLQSEVLILEKEISELEEKSEANKLGPCQITKANGNIITWDSIGQMTTNTTCWDDPITSLNEKVDELTRQIEKLRSSLQKKKPQVKNKNNMDRLKRVIKKYIPHI